MKVRMTVDISGTRNGQEWPPRGEVVDLPDDEGAALCSSGMATPVAVDKVEKAVAAEPEKRATRKRG
jgi:hypothetical protein